MFLLLSNFANSQDSINQNTYKKYYYDNGKISSEGFIKNEKPDGYWKTYYENGILKSEGNRKSFLLDSTWKFYNNAGELKVEINYKNNKKNGLRITYIENEKIEEGFIEDTKQGFTYVYYPSGKLKQKTNFKNGKENGISKKFAEDGRIITITEYKQGFIVNREYINRLDKNGLKQDLWVYFYDNEKKKTEINYKNNLKNGYYKEYDKEGKLTKIEKYINNELQEDVQELKEYEIKKDYYSNGKVKIEGSYINGVAEGIRREFDKEGKIEKAYIFNKGRIIGIGIVDVYGKKQGKWLEYYQTGQIKAEGKYTNNVKINEWKYYYKNKNLEQIGSYNNKGEVDGKWKWYYQSGNLQREENYINGVQNGMYTEYSDDKKEIVKGEYIDGLEEGFWKTEIEDHKEEGKYINGVREENWKHYFQNGKIKYEGKYIDGAQNGRHVHFWDNGNKKEEGRYIMGIKDGEWRKYDYNGEIYLVILYKNGIEKRYDKTKIDPELFEEDME